MSLRIFHILFITLSTLLGLGIAVMEYGSYRALGSNVHLAGSVTAAAFSVIAVAYGVWFLKKTRRLIL